MRLLAIDLGTSGCKAAVFVDGTPTALALVPLRSSHPRPECAEQDPDDWWAALARAIRQVTAEAGDEVEAIGLTGQSDTLVAVDADGRAVRPALLWMDGRGRVELERLVGELGAERIQHRTGLRPGLNFTAPKAAWLAEHEPASMARARWLLQPKDVLALRMTGVAATDPSSASRYLAFDRWTGRWWSELADAARIPVDRLPPILPSAAPIGVLTRGAARVLGLPAGVPVTVGAADRAAEALGCGIGDDEVMVSTGTATGVVRAVAADVDLGASPVITPAGAIAGEAIAVLSQPTSGVVLDWWAGVVGGRPGADGGATIRRLAVEAEASAPGAGGVRCVPHLMGARSIRWRPETRGALTGLTLATSRGDVARAIIEGVSFEVRACLRHLDEALGPARGLVLTGGANRHRVWAQTLVDVTGLPAVRHADRDGALVGAMLLARAASGAGDDLRHAARARLRVDRRYRPDRALAERYDAMAADYEAVQRALEPCYAGAPRLDIPKS